MSRTVVPISQLSRRLPEAGRIRTGVKSGKAMKALSSFRFTSHDREALEQIAGMYGGTVSSWSDPKAAAGQFQVETEAPEIRVVLPPDPLGGTPIYELWGGGGCERRCDGVTCTTMQPGPDGPEPVDVDCLCSAKGALACKVTTRLSVILPEVRFAGVWRLDTKSHNAAQELPGMVDMIRSQQDRGLAYATLSLKHRRSTQAGETHRFIVPQLGIPASIEQLAAGGSRLGSLPASEPERLELVAGDDDEIHDAEIVDGDGAEPVDGPPVAVPCTDLTWSRLLALIESLDEVQKAALKTWAHDQGWKVTQSDLSEEQALELERRGMQGTLL